MRRFVASLLSVAMLIFAVPPAATIAAEEPQISEVRVRIDGAYLDAVVLTLAGRTLVPFRAVGDALGASVGWDQGTQTASLTLSDRAVSLPIGSPTATVTEAGVSRAVTLDVPALLYQSRTYVPARFVAEGLGYGVTYDAATKTVVITSPNVTAGAGDGPGPAEWRRYDVNGDGVIDSSDLRDLIAEGAFNPTKDVNGDGRKDMNDAWALLVSLTEWDRNADGKVNQADFGPVEPIALPAPDAKAADAMAQAMLKEIEPKIPLSDRMALEREWMGFNTADRKVLASLYEQAGMASLLIGNLEMAQWTFARSWVTYPERDAPLSNLGFVKAQQGAYADAMVLYARAREMNPAACTTSSNIAWVFARFDQLDDAKSYYQEAVKACPKHAQLHLNLGAVLLRRGELVKAQWEFAEAARLNPHDKEALMMVAATKPATPGTMEEYEDRYEEERKKTDEEYGEGTGGPEWQHTSARERWWFIIGEAQAQIDEELRQQLKDLGQQTHDKMLKLGEPALPKGTSACDDLTRWNKNWQSSVQAMQRVENAAHARASMMATAAEKRKAAVELSLGDLLLQMVLAEAQAEMLYYSDANEARHAFDQKVHNDYELPMKEAAERLARAAETERLDIPDRTLLYQAVILAGLMMPFTYLDPVYSASLDKCGKLEAEEASKWQTNIEDGGALGISIAIVQLEWKPTTNEIKLQVGQGVLVAGTWSPAAGFGCQAGVGFDIKEGNLKVGGATWIKHGSDGSISVEVEGGGGVESGFGTSWQGSANYQLRAATHEPVGSLN